MHCYYEEVAGAVSTQYPQGYPGVAAQLLCWSSPVTTQGKSAATISKAIMIGNCTYVIKFHATCPTKST